MQDTEVFDIEQIPEIDQLIKEEEKKRTLANLKLAEENRRPLNPLLLQTLDRMGSSMSDKMLQGNNDVDTYIKEVAMSMGRSVSSTAGQLFGGLLLRGGANYLRSEARNSFLGSSYPFNMFNIVDSIEKQIIPEVHDYKEQVIDKVAGYMDKYGEKLYTLLEDGKFAIPPRNPEVYGGGMWSRPSFTKYSSMLAEQFPSMALIYLMGPAGLGLMAGASAGQVVQESAGKVSPDKSLAVAGIRGIGSYLTNKIGMSEVFKGNLTSNIMKEFVKGGAFGGFDSALDTFFGNIVAKVGYDKTRVLMENVIEAGVLNVVTGGTMRAAVGAAGAETISNNSKEINAHIKELTDSINTLVTEGGITPKEFDEVTNVVADTMLSKRNVVSDILDYTIEKNLESVEVNPDIAAPITIEDTGGAVPVRPQGEIIAEKILRNEKLTADEEQQLQSSGLFHLAEAKKDVEWARNWLEDFYAKPFSEDNNQRIIDRNEANGVWNKLSDIMVNKLGLDPVEGVFKLDRIVSPVKAQRLLASDEEHKKYTEADALKTRLKFQQREAANAFKVGKKEAQTIINDLKSLVAKASPNIKAKFFNSVTDIRNARKYYELSYKISQAVELEQKTLLVKEMRQRFKRVMDSEVIAVDYKEQIRSLFEGIRFTQPSKIKLQSLRETEKYINEQAQAGKDTSVPRAVLQTIKSLSYTPLMSKDIGEIKMLLNSMKSLENTGRFKLRTLQKYEERVKENWLDKMEETGNPMLFKQLTRAKVGEEITFSENVHNKVQSLIKFAQQKGESITPVDVLFDVMDGFSNYEGGVTQVFKKSIDSLYGYYLQKRAAKTKETFDLVKSLKLNRANYERIFIYGALQQENGYERLKAGNIDDDEMVHTLTPNETAFYEYIRKNFEDIKFDIADTQRIYFNKFLGDVKNYLPWVTDFNKLSEMPIEDRMNTEIPIELKKKTVQPGLTKERSKRGATPLKLNALEIFLRYMDDAYYLTELGGRIKLLGEVANSARFKEIVGDAGQEYVRNWVDTLARKGGTFQGTMSKFDRMLDRFRNNTNVATLAFRLSTALLQPTAWFNGAAYIGGRDATFGLYATATPHWRNFVLRNFPEIAERFGDDPFLIDFSDTPRLSKLKVAGYYFIKKFDQLTAMSVAIGAYKKKMRELGRDIDFNKPDKDAMMYAERIVRRSQGSAFFKDIPQALSRGTFTGNKAVDRLVFQFQNFTLSNWSSIKHDMIGYGIGQKQYGKMANMFLWFTLAGFAETALRYMTDETLGQLVKIATNKTVDFKGKKYDDGKIEAFISQWMSKVPFANQFTSFAQYGSAPIPALNAMLDVGEQLAIASRITGGTGRKKSPSWKQRKAARYLTVVFEAAGYGLGIPGTSQVAQVGKKLIPEAKEKNRGKRKHIRM